ncbi:uncharacterized protein LOC110018156 isoform X2 [Phalaenopsis equestris]|uniref:uncharacterized protein LOC110018156 isoform X2 n=1 Tax=Phalaenopsis equestris TaxID=78828 RepID=UPI0009E5199E|nr:uncharacterized protein LOC110018156 isoform X2 [Phalaenopsis equestris]
METNDLDAKLSELDACGEPQANGNSKASVGALTDDVQITCFTEDLHDATLHFQIIRFSKQSNSVSITSLLKGNAQNTGSSMAHRLVLKTGLSVVLACNIPKDSPVLEAAAERKLFEKLRNLGCIRTGPSPP